MSWISGFLHLLYSSVTSSLLTPNEIWNREKSRLDRTTNVPEFPILVLL